MEEHKMFTSMEMRHSEKDLFDIQETLIETSKKLKREFDHVLEQAESIETERNEFERECDDLQELHDEIKQRHKNILQWYERNVGEVFYHNGEELIGYTELNIDFVKPGRNCSSCEENKKTFSRIYVCLECEKKQVLQKYPNAISYGGSTYLNKMEDKPWHLYKN